MYVVIEKNSGRIVWAGGDGAEVRLAARKCAQDNPGKAYYAACIYIECSTEVTVTEKTHGWNVDA